MALYYAAKECGDVDRRKIQDILRVPFEKNKEIDTVNQPITTTSRSIQATEGIPT